MSALLFCQRLLPCKSSSQSCSWTPALCCPARPRQTNLWLGLSPYTELCAAANSKARGPFQLSALQSYWSGVRASEFASCSTWKQKSGNNREDKSFSAAAFAAGICASQFSQELLGFHACSTPFLPLNLIFQYSSQTSELLQTTGAMD